jgi:hypothetical protein
MPANFDEHDRRELIREAERERTRLHDEMARVVGPLDQQLAAVEASLRRLTHDLPAGDLCPMCWYGHGVTSPMRGTPEKPVHPMRDRYACRACGHAELRRT